MTGGIAKVMTNEELIRIPIRESGEPLVNIAEKVRNAVIDIENISKNEQNIPDGTCMLRLTAVIMLKSAAIALPKGFRFRITDGYRPIEAQKKLYNQVMEEIRVKNPQLSEEELCTETDKWVANPKVVPPHTTGGALDLTILDGNGNELDMGTPINTVSPMANMVCDSLSANQASNRQLLITTMVSAGFVGNPREWWHWSYGDRRWASVNRTNALYGSVGDESVH
jgi:D-alanyl-D-alanine dipeptidase